MNAKQILRAIYNKYAGRSELSDPNREPFPGEMFFCPVKNGFGDDLWIKIQFDVKIGGKNCPTVITVYSPAKAKPEKLPVGMVEEIKAFFMIDDSLCCRGRKIRSPHKCHSEQPWAKLQAVIVQDIFRLEEAK